MKKLLIATHNPGKLHEISSILSDLPIQIVSLKDLGIKEEVEETGKTYLENAEKKALFFANKTGFPTLGDDGGLEIEALGGFPGVKSKRWVGENATEEDLIAHMRHVAEELPDTNRRAWFKVALSVALPNGKSWTIQESIEGVITKEPHMGRIKGYPFRAFFYIPSIEKYYQDSELTPDEQRLYNHRWKAVQKLKKVIRNVILSGAKNL